ncbi:uncharacterized protein K441DRAFT_595419, partial [Cenococcum geophilum 1.58]
DYLNNFCSAYLDNILIYSNNPFKYTKYRLRDVGLYINLKKCKFLVIVGNEASGRYVTPRH